MRGDHAVHVVAVAVVHLERPGQLLVVLRRLEEAGDGVDRHPARDLARRVAAHAVGDDRQPLALGQVERVLVVGALHAHVRVAREPDPHAVQRKRRAHRLAVHRIAARATTINARLGGFARTRCGGPDARCAARLRVRSGRGRRRSCRPCRHRLGGSMSICRGDGAEGARGDDAAPRVDRREIGDQRQRGGVDRQHAEPFGIVVGAVDQLEAEAHLAHGRRADRRRSRAARAARRRPRPTPRSA